MSRGGIFGNARRKGRARRQARELAAQAVASVLANVAVGELERLAGLSPEGRTAFWTRYTFTPSPARLADAGRRALLDRIVQRVERGELTLTEAQGHG